MKIAGRLILSLVAVVTAVGAYVADWNETHIFNPYWPPHARFHNAQTMLFGTAAGLLCLAFLWKPRAERAHLQAATAFAAMYWVTQMGAICFPGTALQDPLPQGHPFPVVLGIVVTQIHLEVVLLALVLVGYLLAIGQTARDPRPLLVSA